MLMKISPFTIWREFRRLEKLRTELETKYPEYKNFRKEWDRMAIPFLIWTFSVIGAIAVITALTAF